MTKTKRQSLGRIMSVVGAMAVLLAVACQAEPILRLDFAAVATDPVQAGFTAHVGGSNATYSTTAGDVTLTLTDFSSAGIFRPGVSDSGDFTYGALYCNSLFSNEPKATVTLSGPGIDANKAYYIRIFSYDYNPSGGGTRTVTYDVEGDTTGSFDPTSITFDRTAVPTSNYQYSALGTLTPSAAGELSFSLSGPAAAVRLNALELQVIPEPGTLALFGLAGLLLLKRRR